MKTTLKQNTHEFYVSGMHCAACEVLIENKFKKNSKVKSVKASLSKSLVKVESNYRDKESLRNELSLLIEKHGYKLHNSKSETIKKIKWIEFLTAIPVALSVIVLFLVLQKIGIIKLVSTTEINYPFIFLTGIIASVSTCMAVVGGLVLSLSSTYSKETKSFRPQIIFHLSRIISFFFLGGVIGLIGAAFKLTSTVTFIIDLILFLVMVILAINLMDVFPFFRGLQLRMPKFISQKFINNPEISSQAAPILLGTITFFLPCGFTQAMQVQALSTGNFVNGALTMLVFALGTFPVLFAISFLSEKFSQGLQSSLFFKIAGLIIIFFAIVNLAGGLAAAGFISPIFNF